MPTVRRITGGGVRIVGVERILSKIKNISNISADRMAQIGNIGVSGIKSNFEGNKFGWPELQPSTIFAKGSTQILVNKAHLKNSITWRPTSTGLELFTRDMKAGWMHFGTRPHMIYPVRAKALRFKGNFRSSIASRKVSGEYIFAKSVKHTGTPPRPFMVLRDDVKAQMMEVLRAAVREGMAR